MKRDELCALTLAQVSGEIAKKLDDKDVRLDLAAGKALRTIARASGPSCNIWGLDLEFEVVVRARLPREDK